MAKRIKQPALSQRAAQGFTILELVIVLAVLGTLVAIIVPSVAHYIDTARTDEAILEATTAHASLQIITHDAYVHEGHYQRVGSGRIIENVLEMPRGTVGSAPITGALSISSELDALSGTSGHTLLAWEASEGQLISFRVTVPAGVTVAYDGTDYQVIS